MRRVRGPDRIAKRAPAGFAKAHPVEHATWRSIIRRCENPNAENYYLYGGRGIHVCDRWRNSFVAFFNDVGPRPSDEHSIDRRNGALGYQPGNCYWATRIEQANNKRNNRSLTARGETHTLAEWARTVSIDPTLLLARIDRLGWDVEKAIFEPVVTLREAARRARQTRWSRTP
jgi:hypothetical protein